MSDQPKRGNPMYDLMLANDNMKRHMPIMIEYQAMLAQLRKESFKAHIAAGFTEEQALVLCQKVT